MRRFVLIALGLMAWPFMMAQAESARWTIPIPDDRGIEYFFGTWERNHPKDWDISVGPGNFRYAQKYLEEIPRSEDEPADPLALPYIIVDEGRYRVIVFVKYWNPYVNVHSYLFRAMYLEKDYDGLRMINLSCPAWVSLPDGKQRRMDASDWDKGPSHIRILWGKSIRCNADAPGYAAFQEKWGLGWSGSGTYTRLSGPPAR